MTPRAARARRRVAAALALLFAAALAAPAAAVEGDDGDARATTLRELLERARSDRGAEARLAAEREARFLAEREKQRARLAEAEARLATARARSDELGATFARQSDAIRAFEERLDARSGELGELFGTVRQAAAGTVGTFKSSIVSAEIPGRTDVALELADSVELPTIPRLEAFWLALLDEMVATGEIATFGAKIVTRNGAEREADVVRVGAFDVVSDGRFLRYLPESGTLLELSRQPPARFRDMALALQAAAPGEQVDMALDPSRGSILSLMARAPSLVERIRQGRFIGYTILALGAFGLLLGVERVVVLARVGRRVRRQQAELDAPRDDNPLGRLLAVGAAHRGRDAEGLVLRLEEHAQQEMPRLQRGLSTLAVLATTAPLLGLLGTVTGMIATFQSIALVGTGDPRMMSSGISEALVTTALGLIVAIPLSLLHTFVTGRSNRVLQVLDERSARIVADHVEGVARADGDGRDG